MKINIVMVEPEIPQNTGNIARTCAAIGAKLHLVKPLGFEINDKYLKRAGLDYWDKLDIEVHEDLEKFLKKYNNVGAGPCPYPGQRQSIVPTQRKNNKNLNNNFFLASTKSKHVYSKIDYTKYEEIFILFGKETKGLPEDLIESNINQAIRIPMKEGLRSLNLSNSVAIIVYEVLRQNDFHQLQEKSYYFEKNE